VAAATFEVGDTVQLKSGGPVMTITEIEGTQVWCTWFTPEGKLETGTFPNLALVAAM
jgi:uncharacterized protein YodC (DUF2158 family)